jgi:protein SCO1
MSCRALASAIWLWLSLSLALVHGASPVLAGPGTPGEPPEAAGTPASALPEALAGVGFDQRLGEKLPLDLAFKDEQGQEVRLERYFGRRPVILTLVYYECPMLCTLVLNGVISSLRAVPFVVGRDFDIVTVSFDPRDTPELARKKKAHYLDALGVPGADAGWHFLTGDSTAIAALTSAAGFRYTYDPARGEFAHASGILVVTPQGEISRLLYGIEYAPKDVRLALVEAGEGKIGSPIDQMLLFCFHYDPAAGKYGAAVLNLVRAGGVVAMGGIAAFVLLSLRRERRSRALAPGATSPRRGGRA